MMPIQSEKKMASKGLHYHVSDLKDAEQLGRNSISCNAAKKHTVVDYMTSIERKPYENQHLCRKNGIREHKNRGRVGGRVGGWGGGWGGERLKTPPPTPKANKKTLKDIAQDYLTTLESDYVVTNLNSVNVGTGKESFVQLTTEPSTPKIDDHLYDTITGHCKKKEREVNNEGGGKPSPKQDAYYLDIIDDCSKPAFPTSSHSYDEVKSKTLSLSQYRTHIYSSTNREFLNRAKQILTTDLLALLPTTRRKRVITFFVATLFLLCSIWLAVIASASKPDKTNGLVFPTQPHHLIGDGRFQSVTSEIATSLGPTQSPKSDCLQQECDRNKVKLSICASNWVTYESKCDFKIAKCKDPSLYKIGSGSCSVLRSDDMEDDRD